MSRSLTAAILVLSLAVISGLTPANAQTWTADYTYPTHGGVGALSTDCLNGLNNIFNGWYLITATNASQDNRTTPFYLNPARRLGCRLTILEALQSSTNTNCPTQDLLTNCFWIAGDEWKSYIAGGCHLFDSMNPLPTCSDQPGEASEGVPSCSTTAAAADVAGGQGRRRLLQGPTNNQGITQWQFDNGESVGLQYDEFAPVGSPYAQPPNIAVAAGVSGTSAAALGAINEGNEGGSVTDSTVTGNSGCFPGMWDATDFDSYLNGDLVQTSRPKDIGGVNAIGLVSVFVYTILLCSLGLF